MFFNKNSIPEGLYPLTPAENDIVIDEASGGGANTSGSNLMGFSCFADQACNLGAFEQAYNWILEHNDALRLQMVRHKGRLLQRIRPYAYEKLPVVSVKDRADFEAHAAQYLKNYVHLMDEQLFRAQLLDCGNGSGGIVIIWHHIVADGYANAMLFRQTEACYTAFCKGEPVNIKAGSVLSVIEESRAYLASAAYREDRAFWKKRYRDYARGYCIVGGRMARDCTTRKFTASLEGETYEKLMTLSQETGVSIHSIVMSIAALTVTAVTGKTCFSLYTMSHGRSNFKLKQTMGCQTLSIPLLYRFEPSLPLRETLQRDYRDYLEALQHGRLPLTDHLILKSSLSLKNGMNLAHAWLQFSNMELVQETRKSSLTIKIPEKPVHGAVLTCNTFHLTDRHSYSLELNYQVKKLSEARVQALCRAFVQVADRVAATPDASGQEICKGISACL